MDSGNKVEKIFLSDYKINYCRGCEVCNTTHKCVQKDDMASLLDKMLEADVIVLASPVYFYSINAQLKTFIDRCVPKYTSITNKEFYYIITAADTETDLLEKSIETLRGFSIDCLEGTVEKGIIYGTGAWHVGEIKNTKAFKDAYIAGKNA